MLSLLFRAFKNVEVATVCKNNLTCIDKKKYVGSRLGPLPLDPLLV